MPTYQYACTECGERLEAVQSFSDPALTECPACQGKLRKVFNSVGVVFKGSGFYRNDSRKTPESSSADSASKPAESKPAESKPAASSSDSSSSAASKPSKPSTPAPAAS